jgi:diguanylate cyclase (GGDEF)-like protein
MGVLVVSLEISTFSKALRQYKKESKEAFFLLDKNNRLILSTNSEREKYIDKILKDRNYKTGKKYFVIKGENGKNHYYIHKIKKLHLTLIGSINEKVLYSSIYQIRNYIFAVVALVLLIITEVLLIFYRRYNKTLNKLSNIIKAITTGDYSKDIDYMLDGIDEKSELDKMKSAIYEMNYEIIKREEKLRIISEMDTLINIYNRRSMLGFLNKIDEKKKKLRNKYSLIMFDIDNFKKINDEFGHQFGDIVLLNIARKVNYNIKSTDKFGRIGGDEFLILLPSTNLSYGMEVAERIRFTVESMFWEDKDIMVTISIGVTTKLENESVEEVLERVDKALYRAKNKGRNRVEG